MLRYFLRKRTLESEERYLGDGFFPREEEFYSFEKDEAIHNDYNINSLGGIDLYVSKELIHHNRSVYSVLDWLGDVGGLYSILIGLGHFIVTTIYNYIFGSRLEAFLITKIFKTKLLESKENQNLDNLIIDASHKRLIKKQRQLAGETAFRKLDLVAFLRK